MKIYLASGLTHVPRRLFAQYCGFLHMLAEQLRNNSPGHEVKYALIDSDPDLAQEPIEDRARQCYMRDRAFVEDAELIIAEASFPALGLGIELQIAEAMKIPTILCFRDSKEFRASPVDYVNPDGSKHSLQIGKGIISLMALGLPTVRSVISYRTPNEGLQMISDAVLSLNPILDGNENKSAGNQISLMR